MTTQKVNMSAALKSEELFRLHLFLWRILGNSPTKNYRQVYILYSLVINILVTICFPLHLLIGIFKNTSMYDTIKDSTIILTCLCCSLKTILISIKLKNVHKILDIIKRQDERISQSPHEAAYCRRVVFPRVEKIMLVFKLLFTGVALTALMPILKQSFLRDSALMYPAYFPFDPLANSWTTALANAYQSFGVCIQILQNLVNDTFAGMHLSLLSGQIHILGMRVANIGHNRNKTNFANNQELLACVQDHKDLLQ